MHGKSFKDVCAKVGKGMCVILFTDENELSKDLESDLKHIKNQLESSRIKFKFMWAKLGHKDWRTQLQLSETGR